MNTGTIVKRLKDKNFQRSALVFVLCLLLSSVLWMFIHLSKIYPYPVSYTITYNSLPKGKAFAEKPTTSITVIMNDVGFNILSDKLTRSVENIDIDLSGIKLKHVGNYYTGFITSDAIIKRLTIDGNNNIESIIPDTLYFVFSYTDTRKVPVKVDISYKIAKESDLFGDIEVTPDSVMITATKDVLDKIQYIETAKKNLGVCDQTITTQLSLVNPYPNYLEMSTNAVSVTLPIFKMTEGETTVTISDTTMNGSIVRALPSTVKITYTVPLDLYNRVNADMFTVKLKCDSPSSSGVGVNINVVKCPDFVKIRKVEPSTAEYILFK